MNLNLRYFYTKRTAIFCNAVIQLGHVSLTSATSLSLRYIQHITFVLLLLKGNYIITFSFAMLHERLHFYKVQKSCFSTRWVINARLFVIFIHKIHLEKSRWIHGHKFLDYPGKRNHTHQDPDMKRIATNKTCKNLGSK